MPWWPTRADFGAGLASFEKGDRRASISVGDQGDEDTLCTIETGVRRN